VIFDARRLDEPEGEEESKGLWLLAVREEGKLIFAANLGRYASAGWFGSRGSVLLACLATKRSQRGYKRQKWLGGTI
jgi:hypothetical protein